MDGLKTFALTASSVTLLSIAIAWQIRKAEKRKIAEKILQSPNTSWKKVGTVKELYCYPLKSGYAKSIEECFFDEYGIICDDGVSSFKDRMFIIYNGNKNTYLSGKKNPKLVLVNMSIINKEQVKLEAPDMPPLIFTLPKSDEKIMKIIMVPGVFFDLIDCGEAVSKWFSKYLAELKSEIRLGIHVPGNRRSLTKGPFVPLVKSYTTMRDEDAGIFADMMSYMLLSDSSVTELNQKLEKPVPARQYRPNIVVEGCDPYAEDDWEWIKIGNEAVIRNIKPCTRCIFVRIDPDSGIPDPQHEPLMTLRKYRKLKDPVLDALERYSPAMGIYCGLYRTGNVKIGDDVFVYQSDEGNSKIP